MGADEWPWAGYDGGVAHGGKSCDAAQDRTRVMRLYHSISHVRAHAMLTHRFCHRLQSGADRARTRVYGGSSHLSSRDQPDTTDAQSDITDGEDQASQDARTIADHMRVRYQGPCVLGVIGFMYSPCTYVYVAESPFVLPFRSSTLVHSILALLWSPFLFSLRLSSCPCRFRPFLPASS